MAPFVIPAVVAAGLGALYLATRPTAAETAAAAKAKAAASAAPTAATFPPDLKPELDRLLNSPPDQDPAALETVATRLETLGFKQEATALRLKAAQLRAAQGASVPAPPAPPAPAPAPAAPAAATPPPFVPGVIDTPPAPQPTQFVPGVIDSAAPAPSPPSLNQARVTTSDPAPDGDLIVRDQPNESGSIVGAAEKDGVVTVVDPNASSTFAEIVWAGGSRRPAVHGFAHKAFLQSI